MVRMKLGILAGTMLAAGVVAQPQSSAPANPQAPTNAAAPSATNTPAIPNGPAVNAELNSSVDSKKAKVGDKVEARTMEALRNGNDIVIPKGTKLLGHVTAASARSKGDPDSMLAIQFDKAVPKKEQEIPLNFLIFAVAPPAQNNFDSAPGVGVGSMPNTSPAAASGSPMGTSHTPTQTPTNSPTGNAQDADGTAAGGPSVSGPLPANSRGIYGLKDLKLILSTKDNAQITIITSTGKDVRLDGGTRLLLVEQGSAPAAPAQ